MFCTKCGNDDPNDAQFCAGCEQAMPAPSARISGAPLSPRPTPTEMAGGFELVDEPKGVVPIAAAAKQRVMTPTRFVVPAATLILAISGCSSAQPEPLTEREIPSTASPTMCLLKFDDDGPANADERLPAALPSIWQLAEEIPEAPSAQARGMLRFNVTRLVEVNVEGGLINETRVNTAGSIAYTVPILGLPFLPFASSCEVLTFVLRAKVRQIFPPNERRVDVSYRCEVDEKDETGQKTAFKNFAAEIITRVEAELPPLPAEQRGALLGQLADPLLDAAASASEDGRITDALDSISSAAPIVEGAGLPDLKARLGQLRVQVDGQFNAAVEALSGHTLIVWQADVPQDGNRTRVQFVSGRRVGVSAIDMRATPTAPPIVFTPQQSLRVKRVGNTLTLLIVGKEILEAARHQGEVIVSDLTIDGTVDLSTGVFTGRMTGLHYRGLGSVHFAVPKPDAPVSRSDTALTGQLR